MRDSAAIEFRDAWEEVLEDASALTPAQASQPLEGTGGAGSAASTEDAPAQTSANPEAAAQQPPLTLQQMGEEVQRLRAQVQTLQGQLETQQQESAAVAQGMGQELTGMRERAQELERLRTQNLALMQEASTWLAAADQSLDTGELDVDNALAEADAMLAEALQNASSAGRGNAAAQVQSARGFIAQAIDAAGRRDVYYARWALLYAADRLRAAHGDTLDPQGTSALSP